MVVPFFAPPSDLHATPRVSATGIDLWTDTHRIVWDWAPPQIFAKDASASGWSEIGPAERRGRHVPYASREPKYMASSSRSMIRALEGGGEPLYISAVDLRQAPGLLS